MGPDFYQGRILPHAGIIIKICRAYTDNQADFEDYYQEVCLQVWRSRDNHDGQCAWTTWIYRIALNVCLTNQKQNKKHSQNAEEPHTDTLIAPDTPFENEDINRLYGAIRQLSEVDRAVILLYLDEKSYQEIADIIGTKANNIGVRVNRIKTRLEKLLKEND